MVGFDHSGHFHDVSCTSWRIQRWTLFLVSPPIKELQHGRHTLGGDVSARQLPPTHNLRKHKGMVRVRVRHEDGAGLAAAAEPGVEQEVLLLPEEAGRIDAS
jgi:hypothetical protein